VPHFAPLRFVMKAQTYTKPVNANMQTINVCRLPCCALAPFNLRDEVGVEVPMAETSLLLAPRARTRSGEGARRGCPAAPPPPPPDVTLQMEPDRLSPHAASTMLSMDDDRGKPTTDPSRLRTEPFLVHHANSLVSPEEALHDGQSSLYFEEPTNIKFDQPISNMT